MAKRKEFDISDPPTNMFDMKEWERFMVKEKKKVIITANARPSQEQSMIATRQS